MFYLSGENAETLGLTGKEFFSFVEPLAVGKKTLKLQVENGSETPVVFEVDIRINTPTEWDYYQNGGILHAVLRELIREK